ncbi:MAG TPA: DUF423 domain-containing protein [Gammaproteobacteria bacterium]|nr:DUF423 domain-containing protein [Gammaproteobacteria bacterium]
MNGRGMVVAGCLAAFAGVALGAFGAHALRGALSDRMLEVWQTAVQYNLVHALGLVLAGLLARYTGEPRVIRLAGGLMLAGVLLFCGSLYLLAVTGIGWLGAVTPFGGVAFLVSWLLLARGAWRHL